MGIRPEHIRFQRNAEGRKETVRGKLYVIEPLGTEVIYDLEIGQKVVRVRAFEEQLQGLNVRMGQVINLEFPQDFIYLFDGETGKTVAQASFALAHGAHK
jgi:ABC-type sugar transport system ATPase subunit